MNGAELVLPTKRKGIKHLLDMNDQEFVYLAKLIKSELNGNIQQLHYSMKCDGAGIRFGLDSERKRFMEGSNSGVQYSHTAFADFIRQQGISSGPKLHRAECYDSLFSVLCISGMFSAIPSDCKVICEAMYVPMAEVVDTQLIFVRIPYDADKLGRVLTLVPLDVVYASTGERRPDISPILQSLYKKSNEDIKIFNPTMMVHPRNITDIIRPVLNFTTKEIQILSSRKQADKSVKVVLKETVADVKWQLTKLFREIEYVGSGELGDKFEGVVISYTGYKFKVISEDFT